MHGNFFERSGSGFAHKTYLLGRNCLRGTFCCKNNPRVVDFRTYFSPLNSESGSFPILAMYFTTTQIIVTGHNQSNHPPGFLGASLLPMPPWGLAAVVTSSSSSEIPSFPPYDRLRVAMSRGHLIALSPPPDLKSEGGIEIQKRQKITYDHTFEV